MNLEPPKLTLPPLKKVKEVADEDTTKSMPNSPTQSHIPQNVRTNSSSFIDESEGPNPTGLAPYLQNLETRIEGDSHIQVVRELTEVPVLLRAEIGMTFPCLTVRVLNPFT